MDSLDGTISRVCFHKPSKYNPAGTPFLIARLTSGATVKGEMRRPAEGELYRFFGEMKPQKNGYDEAFEFVSYEPLCEKSDAGIASYLAAHVDSIGRVKATAIVETFGADTLDILRSSPEKALDVPGITEAHVSSIRTHFADSSKLDPAAYAKLMEMFADFRISKKIVEKLVKGFGSDAPQMIRDNPYLLLAFPRIGWKTVDAFALSVAEYDAAGLERHQAAILEAMERISAEGHTCATETELLNQAEHLLGNSLREDALLSLIDEDAVIETFDEFGPIYQLARMAEAEDAIADKLAVLTAAGRPLLFPLVTQEWLTATGLGDDQAEAARLVERHPVVIVSGPPGTGKSFTLSRLLGRLKANGIFSIRVVAPTGKAAKRAAELLAEVEGCEGIPSTTVHKALAPQPSGAEEGVPSADARFGRGRDEFGFGRNEEFPLDEQVIVVDESSMLDVRLAASLLRAIKPGTRVIFVGDHNQLPSVGPGSVLRDMMSAGIPTAVLTEIRRSDGGGTVVRACHAIKDGIIPHDADSLALPTDNWIHLEIADPHEIARKIVELHATTRKFDPIWDMQVVSPQKAKLPVGCDNLNRLLSHQLNPDAYTIHSNASTVEESEINEPSFHVGDKVVRTKNGLADELVAFRGPDDKTGKSIPDLRWRGQPWASRETPIVNGDMGQILDIVLDDHPSVIVEFRDPTRLCRLSYRDSYLILAYALTVHKMQGSGAPYVIVPVHHSFYFDAKTGKGLFTRELIYTAISRAEVLLITVGQWSALQAAIGRKTVERRKTTLARRLERLIERPDVTTLSPELLEYLDESLREHAIA